MDINYQHEWDTQLVYGARAGINTTSLACRFVNAANQELYKDFREGKVEFQALVNFINSLN